MMKAVLFVALAAVMTLPCLAQDADRQEVRKSLDDWWAARKADVLATVVLGAGEAPAGDPSGIHACPSHRGSMLEFLLDEDLRRGPDGRNVVVRRRVAAWCSHGAHVYVRTEEEGGPARWRGPFSTGAGRTGPPAEVSRESVEKCLMRHLTDSGDQGFYEHRFADLQEFGPGAIPHVFDIFETSDDPQIRHIAIEALVEIADESCKDRLRKLALSPAATPHRISLAAALHRLGDPSLADRLLESLRGQLARARGTDEKAALESQLGFVYSILWKEEEAIAHYTKAVELDPANAIAFYNLACCHGKLGRIDEALQALEKAIEAGYRGWEWMMVDGDLEAVRNDPRFLELRRKHGR